MTVELLIFDDREVVLPPALSDMPSFEIDSVRFHVHASVGFMFNSDQAVLAAWDCLGGRTTSVQKQEFDRDENVVLSEADMTGLAEESVVFLDLTFGSVDLSNSMIQKHTKGAEGYGTDALRADLLGEPFSELTLRQINDHGEWPKLSVGLLLLDAALKNNGWHGVVVVATQSDWKQTFYREVFEFLKKRLDRGDIQIEVIEHGMSEKHLVMEAMKTAAAKVTQWDNRRKSTTALLWPDQLGQDEYKDVPTWFSREESSVAHSFDPDDRIQAECIKRFFRHATGRDAPSAFGAGFFLSVRSLVGGCASAHGGKDPLYLGALPILLAVAGHRKGCRMQWMDEAAWSVGAKWECGNPILPGGQARFQSREAILSLVKLFEALQCREAAPQEPRAYAVSYVYLDAMQFQVEFDYDASLSYLNAPPQPHDDPMDSLPKKVCNFGLEYSDEIAARVTMKRGETFNVFMRSLCNVGVTNDGRKSRCGIDLYVNEGKTYLEIRALAERRESRRSC